MQMDHGNGTNPGRSPAPTGHRLEPAAARRGVGQSDALTTLRWGLRRYVAVLVGCLLVVGVLVPAYLITRPAQYQSEALVVAQRLDTDLVALPRFGEAVFGNGEVAQRVAAQFGDGGDPETVVPNEVSLVADQDSIVFQVIGYDTSPTVAADKANLAARVFTDQLNLPGQGVGAFAVQTQAIPPAAPVDDFAGSIAVPIGLLAGLLLGVAAVAVIVVVRRPVLEPADAEAVAGVPVIGTIRVPRSRPNDLPEPGEASGATLVCRRLLSMRASTIVLMSPPAGDAQKRKAIVALAHVLGRITRLRTVADPVITAATDPGAGPMERGNPAVPKAMTLVDNTQATDLPELTVDALAVLVIPTGTPASVLRSASAVYLGGADSGRILLVDEVRQRGGRRTGSGATPEDDASDAGEPSDPRPVPAPVVPEQSRGSVDTDPATVILEITPPAGR